MSEKQFAVIMAGGIGERLWPLSRKSKPKQFLKLYSDKSMFEETIERIAPMIPLENVLIVTNSVMKELIQNEHPNITDDNFLVEPKRRNTASAILYAATHIKAKHGDGKMFVLTSDHFIKPRDRFLESLRLAGHVAESGKLVLLGVEPSRPETGYGYIEVDLDNPMTEYSERDVYPVSSFKEKPNMRLADKYYIDSVHLWNSGMFIWKVSAILEAAKKSIPDVYGPFNDLLDKYNTDEREKAVADVFERVPSISIDKGVMERASDVAVVRANFVWDDMGSFLALPRVFQPDSCGNIEVGNVKSRKSIETIVFNSTEKPIVTFGLTDSIVVRTDDVVLVLSKSEAPNMAELLKTIREEGNLDRYM